MATLKSAGLSLSLSPHHMHLPFLNWSKESSCPFKQFYAEWFHSLKKNLLPFLHSSISSVSTSHVPVQCHPLGAVLTSASASASSSVLLSVFLLLYFQDLDLAACHDASQLPCPDWRNSLEKPFLWFGDLHPCLFAYLLRSFLANEEEDDDGNASKPYSTSIPSVATSSCCRCHSRLRGRTHKGR